MRLTYTIAFLLLLSFCVKETSSFAQEKLAPIEYNPVLKNQKIQGFAVLKTTASDTLALPFFEDFTSTNNYDGYSPFPDASKWFDNEVYINNTMCVHPISRGVATFDGLDKFGIPYDSILSTHLLYADSLTSKYINLGSNLPSDSIYFSFFYQPQGNGFSPETDDSLMLYFKNSTEWQKVWSKEGTNVQPFQQVMIPVTDTAFLHGDFQFRFVNKASMNTNDDVWNVDYIRMSVGRGINDTAVNDVAFNLDPTYLFNDYTYMPYNQYLANAANERATTISTRLKNNSGTTQSVNYSFTATCGGTTLSASGPTSININANSEQAIGVASYTNTVPQPAVYDDWVTFENKFFIQSVSATDHKENDTIILEQTFHNELAYDDGTAEESYYLNLFNTLPGKIAVEYHLNTPDTLKGLAIYFGRQVPSGSGKYFSIDVYNLLGTNGGPDGVLDQEDLFLPGYLNVNNFYIYQLEHPVILPAGTFYVGTTQPALSNSDSLYIGLDANRTTNNHLFYNVLGYWQPSIITGALMIRPIFGPIIASNVENVNEDIVQKIWSVTPNPVKDAMQFHFDSYKNATYEVYDIQGRVLMAGSVKPEQIIGTSNLLPGMYMVHLTVNGAAGKPQKIIKL